MSNIYTWLIDSLECLSLEKGQVDVVSIINWRVHATDGAKNATINGSQLLKYIEGSSFIPYSQLAQNTLIEWLKNSMGSEQVNNIQMSLDNQLNNSEAPTVVFPSLPWIKE
jgi:hypothetical protein